MACSPDYTLKDAAAELQVSPGLVRGLIGKGELAAYKVGRMIRITKESLQQYKANSAIGAHTRAWYIPGVSKIE